MSTTPSATPEPMVHELPAPAGPPKIPKAPRIFRIILGTLGVIVALLLLLTVYGMTLPADHLVNKTMTLAQPPEAIYAVIADWERYPEWRTQLASVTAAPDPQGHVRWREAWKGSEALELSIVRSEPPELLEIMVHDPSGMFEGTWLFVLTAKGNQCEIALTEHGRILQPLPRALMQFWPGGKDMYVNLYLDQLKAKFGEGAPPSYP